MISASGLGPEIRSSELQEVDVYKLASCTLARLPTNYSLVLTEPEKNYLEYH